MTSLDLAFGATGLLALVGGLLAVTTRHVVHAALWLVVALLGVAGSLLVLGSELVSLVLVLVYVGAIVVLVLFALMVTRAPDRAGHRPHRRLAAPDRWRPSVAPPSRCSSGGPRPPRGGASGGAIKRAAVDSTTVAQDLFGVWVWPFEILSLLLLAALVAALAVSRIRRDETEVPS
ncbi:MAG: NADH-quinone oxidoreductase subunit J [Tetrasphaera sp.]|nr:NADH-quinone oxidoreductase subunit J [Tetrasphaera sp.]